MENKTPEEIADYTWDLWCDYYRDGELTSIETIAKVSYAIVEFGKQQYNQGVKDCIENASARVEYDDFDGTYDAIINESSMKKLLKQ